MGAGAAAKRAAPPARPLDPAGKAALARILRVNPKANPRAVAPDVSPNCIPRHISFIMDGNGRWARDRGLPRLEGHKQGVEAALRTLEACWALGVEVVTLYSFSTDNWKRSDDEVQGLMALCVQQLPRESPKLRENNIRFRRLGRRSGLPDAVLAELDEAEAVTASCTGPTLCVAINYGAREELVDAARSLARAAASGEIDPGDISERHIAQRLTTAGLPDPDLLIRTAGEYRVSNYLLWQISYAELHVTPTRWPDFGHDGVVAAVRDFAQRQRRFGAEQPVAPADR